MADITEDVQQLAEAEPATARRPRALRVLVWLVAVVVIVAGGTVTAVVAHRDHWLDAERQLTMHQLNILSHPAGFRTVAPAAGETRPGWDPVQQLGRRYYDGTMVPREMTAGLDFWLGRGGVLTSAGPREASHCQRVTLAGTGTFGCGNFYRETPQWRVWITVSGQGWPGRVVPPPGKPTPVHLLVVIQHKHSLEHSYESLGWTSPGLTVPIAPGSARTVLTLSAGQAKQVDLDGATFGPAGQLVTAGPGAPAVIPATAGAAAQRLTYTSWATVQNEVGSAQVNDTTTDVARIGPDGSLWAHFPGYGLRRLDPAGHTTDITGNANGNGQLTEGAAIGQDPYTVAEPTAISADGTVWVADGQLVRIRNDKLHLIDPQLTGVNSVVGDGHNGVYFADPTRLFHLSGTGVRRIVATGFTSVTSVAPARDGSVYLLDGAYLRRVHPDGEVDTVAGRGGTVSGRDDPVFCALPVPTTAAQLPISAAYDVIASPLGGVYLTGCNRVVQIA